MRSPKGTYQEGTKFMAASSPPLSGPHREEWYILNTWTRPLSGFLITPPKLLAKKRAQRLSVSKQSSSHTKRATAALTVTVSGDWLLPPIIFNGSSHGKICLRGAQEIQLLFLQCMSDEFVVG
jgi:hypothetical protein